MDPTVARILDDLKEMLLAKAISPADYLEGVAAAHSRASSVEKEAPVKIEAPVTEMQETPVKFEAPVTEMQEELLKQEAPVKMEAPSEAEQEVSDGHETHSRGRGLVGGYRRRRHGEVCGMQV